MATYTNIPTGIDAAELDELFGRIAAEGERVKTAAMAVRVQPYLTANWAQFLATYSPPGYIPALTPTQAIVSNGGSVVVHNLADANQAGSPGTATVVASVLTKVNLTV
jgi:hypothetical protein